MTPTLADEFMEDHKRRMTEAAKGTSPDAVYARLALKLHVSLLHDWLEDERKRGTDAEVLHHAFGTAMGGLMVNFIMGFDNPVQSGSEALTLIATVMMSATAGDLKSTAVMVNDDGTQREVTIDAAFRERMEKLKGGPR